MAERMEKTGQILQMQLKRFSRVEKAFYFSIAVTTLIVAISIIFMQTKLLQVQNDLTKINAQIEEKRPNWTMPSKRSMNYYVQNV